MKTKHCLAKCRFARTRLSYQTDDLFLRHRQGNIFDGMHPFFAAHVEKFCQLNNFKQIAH